MFILHGQPTDSEVVRSAYHADVFQKQICNNERSSWSMTNIESFSKNERFQFAKKRMLRKCQILN